MTKHTKKNIDYTLSTFSVEGLKPSREAIKLCEQMGDKKVSLDEAIHAIKVRHGVAGKTRA